MARYIVLALNGPTAEDGAEARFNRWYDEVHVPDLLETPGLEKARRFKILKSSLDWPYVAAYEIETDDLDATMAVMQRKMGELDPSFDKTRSGFVLAAELG